MVKLFIYAIDVVWVLRTKRSLISFQSGNNWIKTNKKIIAIQIKSSNQSIRQSIYRLEIVESNVQTFHSISDLPNWKRQSFIYFKIRNVIISFEETSQSASSFILTISLKLLTQLRWNFIKHWIRIIMAEISTMVALVFTTIGVVLAVAVYLCKRIQRVKRAR